MLLNTGEYKESLGHVVKIISSARSNAAQNKAAERSAVVELGQSILAIYVVSSPIVLEMAKILRRWRGFGQPGLAFLSTLPRTRAIALCLDDHGWRPESVAIWPVVKY